MEIALSIRDRIPCRVNVEDSIDPRSYRIDSSKLVKLGFTPKYNVGFAIEEIKAAFDSGLILNEGRTNRVAYMREKGLGKIEKP